MIEVLLPMDPQTANNLDPKLQATYDRVMGTNPAAPTTGQSAAPAAPAPAPAPVGQSAPAPAAPNQGMPTPAYAADTLSFQAAIQQPAAAAPAQAPLVVPQQSSGLLKVLYIIGGIVFFVVYTFVWIKIFNIPLPF